MADRPRGTSSLRLAGASGGAARCHALTRAAAAALLVSLVAVYPLSSRARGEERLDRTRYIGVEEIRPGMKGYGLSVFAGSRIDTFHVEVLGVRHDYFPQNDMILAYGTGHGLEKSGIVAGMSGSPVYLDGRLAGALAYGWDFQSAPVMGITPIASMLPISGAALVPAEAGAAMSVTSGGRAFFDTLLTTRGVGVTALVLERLSESLAPGAGGSGEGVRRTVPLWMSGLDPGALPGLAPFLSAAGFVPLAAGAGGAPGDGGGALTEAALVPGAAVAVQIVQGDASLSAVGTVTWREGDRILAFGHPMFHLGRAEFPMSTATIETVMPSFESSFKFGTASRVVGTIDIDLRNGIGGRIGAPPRTIPLTITVDDPLAGGSAVYHYEIADSPFLTPVMCASMSGSSLIARGKRAGDTTVDVRTTIRLVDGRTLSGVNTLNVGSPSAASTSEIIRPLSLLYDNPWEKVTIASVEQRIALRHRSESLSLVHAVLLTPSPHAGETARVAATFQNFRGESLERTLELRLPDGLTPREYTLQVCDSGGWMEAEGRRAPGRFRPQSLDGMLELLNDEPSGRQLILALVDTRPGVTAPGRELGRLPGSVLAAFRTPGVEDGMSLTQGTVEARRVIDFDAPVEGCIDLKLTLTENPRGSGAKGSR